MGRFKRYFLYRTVLFISILGISLFFLKDRAGLFPLLIFLLVFIIDEILVYTLQKEVKLFNILIDSTYLSMFVVFTGGVFSPFAPFYFTLIVLAAYLLSPLDSFIIAGYAALLYGLISLVIPSHITGRFILIELPEALSLPDVLLKYVIYSLSFIFTAALSSFIVERFRKEVVRLKIDTGDILEAIDYGIITLDGEGRVVWSNSTASTIVERELREGMLIDEILPELFYNSLKKIFKTGKKEIEFDFQGRIYKARKNDLRQGQGMILLIFDVTEDKELEQKMQMREKLVTLGQFAANLAHSVRNPVSSIRASAELFDIGGEHSKKNRRLKKFIIEESDHLNDLVRNFLDFTRDFAIHLVPVHPQELCAEVKGILLKSKYFNENISIEVNVNNSIEVEADYALFKNALMNLGTNSLKAMVNGGTLTFNALQNDRVTIEIEDTGCGMAEDDMDCIFSSFYSGFNDGFGFGLPIVKKIIELHGWDLTVESQLNRGTKVSVII